MLARDVLKIRAIRTGTDNVKRAHAIVRCVKCGAEGTKRLVGRLSPEFIAKRFRQKGWEIDGAVAVCPVCVAAGKSRLLAARAGEPDPSDDFRIGDVTLWHGHPVSTPTSASTPQPSPASSFPSVPSAPAAPSSEPTSTPASPPMPMSMSTPSPAPVSSDMRRLVRAKLDEWFDDAKGRYLDGWSDDRVAEACGTATDVVASLREAAYGPLVPQEPEIDPAILKIETELADTIAKIEEFGSVVRELQRMLAGLKGER